jgi:DNA-binding response OmpR family regulator
MIFQSSGARVLIENDCKGASRALEQIRPDIIILNLNEIDLDDSVYCEQIKEKFSKSIIPVIVTSTIPVSQYKERLSYLEGIQYFQKPYSSLQLLNTVSEALEVSMPTNKVRPFRLQAE